MNCKVRVVLLAGIILFHLATAMAQQKGRWVPGQFGLNAEVIPDSGITYANMALSYSASQLNGPNGNQILQNVTGTYSFWVDENIFYYVPDHKFLGGYFMPYMALNYASGSLVADLPIVPGVSLSASGGGSGLADTFVEPVNMGWHLKRADFNAGYAFTARTGRYSGTSANLATDWEIHGQRRTASIPSGQISNKTPGQAFTIEWGFGQVLPLKKNMSMLAQLGLVGYDQWQVRY
jgi:hypothetical protein